MQRKRSVRKRNANREKTKLNQETSTIMVSKLIEVFPLLQLNMAAYDNIEIATLQFFLKQTGENKQSLKNPRTHTPMFQRLS